MSQRSQRLLDVQRLDGEISRLTGLLKQADGALGDTMQARTVAYALRQAETALQTRQREQREQEFELATLESRIKDHEHSLYSGKGSPRDLQVLQQDIERDKARKGALEEQVLAAMDAVDAAQKESERIKTAARRVLGDAATRVQQIESERTQLQARLAAATAHRAAAAATLPAPDAALYERLHTRMPDGVAVASVVQGRCEGCRTTLPSAEVQHARRAEDLVQCSRCGRILHVPVG
jgi:predicted  nucleic acid-binding Zn-ribbon protein